MKNQFAHVGGVRSLCGARAVSRAPTSPRRPRSSSRALLVARVVWEVRRAMFVVHHESARATCVDVCADIDAVDATYETEKGCASSAARAPPRTHDTGRGRRSDVRCVRGTLRACDAVTYDACDVGFVFDDARTGCVAAKGTSFRECSSRTFLHEGRCQLCTSS